MIEDETLDSRPPSTANLVIPAARVAAGGVTGRSGMLAIPGMTRLLAGGLEAIGRGTPGCMR